MKLTWLTDLSGCTIDPGRGYSVAVNGFMVRGGAESSFAGREIIEDLGDFQTNIFSSLESFKSSTLNELLEDNVQLQAAEIKN